MANMAKKRGIKAGVFSLPVNALKGLGNNPKIRYITPDRELFGSMDSLRPAVGADLALEYGWDGTDVGVANGNGSWEVPVTATYVIGKDQRVMLADCGPDYRKRLEPETVLTVLQSKT